MIPEFNVIVPQPFRLEDQDRTELLKLRDEVLDKIKTWEKRSEPFFGESLEAANSWRMIPRSKGMKKPNGLFNSKSGETNRAANTLSTVWHRMMWTQDPPFEARAQGLNDLGMEIDESELFGVENVIMRQLQVLKYKKKLLKTLRSIALFGTGIVENPWISFPIGSQMKSFEGTDFVFRSLLQMAFDPYTFDLDSSDFMASIDFPSKYRLRGLAETNGEVWSKQFIEQAISDQETDGSSSPSFDTDTFNRINNRKQRAGYDSTDKNFFELITYHGKLETSNKILQAYWESEGRTDDIRFSDFTIGILNGKEVVRLHSTPYGTWHHLFKTASVNEFELEPIGYGVGKLGKKYQRELDVTQSRAGDSQTLNLYGMWKASKYAGLKASDLAIKPMGIIELEDINQLEQLKGDPNNVVQALAMMGIWKEDFRTITGASTNLQAAQDSKAVTATEASLSQNEAIRGASVTAEIIADSLVREYIETCHINNTELLDNEIYVELAGSDKPRMKGYNRHNLPRNVGFRILTTTDKDFRPEQLKNLLQYLQIATSVRQIMPDFDLRPILAQIAKSLGINPREITRPQPLVDQLAQQARRAQAQGGIGNEVAGEVADESAGGQANSIPTPVGPVPTSPNSPSLVESF